MGLIADPMVDAVFDARTGYHVITKPAGTFENHPGGEGNPAVFTIIRSAESQLPELWRWSESEELVEHVADNVWRIRHPRTGEGRLIEDENEPRPALEVEHLPVAKLDLAAHRAVRVADPSSRLQNVYTIDSLRAAPGSIDDFLTEQARFDTLQNAVLTVGTGKTHATISAAITAASGGDCIEVYAGGAANVYTEHLAFGKQLQMLGMVAEQGITITESSGHVVTLWNACYFYNFTVAATGTAATAVRGGAYGTTIDSIVGSGGTQSAFDNGYPVTTMNCVALDGNYGFGKYQSYLTPLYLHCTAIGCTVGFQAYPYKEAACGCLGANNGTDFAGFNDLYCANNVSEDATAPGAGSVTGFLDTDLENTWHLKASVAATTKALFYGRPRAALDALKQLRKTAGTFFAGAHTPDPDVPSTPDAPSITGVSASGTTLTATVDGDDEVTNYVQLRRAATGEVVDEQSRSGDGEIALSADEQNEAYALVTYSQSGGYRSKPGAPWPIYVSGGVTSGEIASAIVSRLSSASAVTSRLASSEAIYRRRPPRAASFPCITYEIATTPDPDAVGLGKLVGELELVLWGFERDVLEELLEAVDSALSGERISTANWEIKHVARVAAEPAGSELTLPSTGRPLESLATRWVLRAYRKES